MSDSANLRKHPRVDVPLLVQYRYGPSEELHTEYALNVSVGGMFISTQDSKPLGTQVYVQLTTRDGAHFLQGEGKVVRCVDGGYAIELLGFAPESEAILEQLVNDAMAKQAGTAPVRRPR